MTAIERAEKLINSHLCVGQLYGSEWHNLYFTEAGFARFGSIVGYGLGLAEAGKIEFAEKFLSEFFGQLDRLNASQLAKAYFEQTTELIQSNGYNRFAPVTKTILSDDGTRHGLSFCVFRLIPADKFESGFAAFRWRYCAAALKATPFEERAAIRREMTDSRRWDWFKAADKAYRESLNCDARLTPAYDRDAYRFAYNGALLYHGGKSNALAVTLTSCLFSCHT